METQAQGRPPQVLIADAHEWSARSWASLLAPRGYEVVKAHTGPEVLATAIERQPDAIVVLENLPETDVLNLVHTLRADPQVPLETVVVVTTVGPTSRTWRLAALRAGVNDVWGMPMDTEEMTLRLEAQLRAKFAASRARDEGLIDGATGLYNRKGLTVRARDLASHASRRRAALACVVFALDRDGGGGAEEARHQTAAGQPTAAIHALAEGLKLAARTSDAVGRVGPVEFAVFAPDTDAHGAR
ncbi:MAG TPA: response regulator, partial [Gemmatimonadales bacterium]|nr:response regulator [Gemmatimonadales bacterium]